VIVRVGEKENVAPLRFAPVTASVNADPARAAFGLSVRITGCVLELTVNPLVSVSISLPVVRVTVLVPAAAEELMFTMAVAVAGELTVNDATVIPAPKLAVVVACAQFVNWPASETDRPC
jgi:hypothetical protein